MSHAKNRNAGLYATLGAVFGLGAACLVGCEDNSLPSGTAPNQQATQQGDNADGSGGNGGYGGASSAYGGAKKAAEGVIGDINDRQRDIGRQIDEQNDN